MSALTGSRNTDKMSDRPVPETWNIGGKANLKYYPGAIIALELSSGFVVPASSTTGLVALGRCEASSVVDMTGLNNGDKLVPVRSGVFPFANSAGADAIAAANIGQDCFLVDDQTVALNEAVLGVGQPARSLAGKIMQVDSSGVWVMLAPWLGAAPSLNPKMAIAIPLDLATLANAQSYNFTPGFAGRILKTSFVVRKPATTAAKAATLQPAVATVACTGGNVALTSANCTPAGAEVAQAGAITAGNKFTAAQQCNLQISGVTAFVEGDGTALVWVG